jgi:hypothetical protein
MWGSRQCHSFASPSPPSLVQARQRPPPWSSAPPSRTSPSSTIRLFRCPCWFRFVACCILVQTVHTIEHPTRFGVAPARRHHPSSCATARHPIAATCTLMCVATRRIKIRRTGSDPPRVNTGQPCHARHVLQKKSLCFLVYKYALPSIKILTYRSCSFYALDPELPGFGT